MEYRKINRYKYELMEITHIIVPFTVPTDILTPFITVRGNILGVRKGYCWDGASGPTIDTPSTMRGSLFHDALYQLMRMGLIPQDTKADADELFYKLIKQDGMGRIRAWYYYHGVKSFGRNSARVQDREPKIYSVGSDA